MKGNSYSIYVHRQILIEFSISFSLNYFLPLQNYFPQVFGGISSMFDDIPQTSIDIAGISCDYTFAQFVHSLYEAVIIHYQINSALYQNFIQQKNFFVFLAKFSHFSKV